jgi:hypothetical protein
MKELPMREFLSKLKDRFLALKRWQQALVVIGVLLFMFAPVGANQENDNETGVVPSPVASIEPTPVPSSTPVATPSSTPAPSASAPSADRCVAVSAKKLKNIATGLTVGGGGSLTNGFAVKSNDYAEVWFIAAVIDGPGMGNGVVGIWASNRLEANDGLIFAIDAFAEEFSDWGVGSTTDANITQSDDGAQEAAQCAGKP